MIFAVDRYIDAIRIKQERETVPDFGGKRSERYHYFDTEEEAKAFLRELYGAAWRAAKALGYRRLITYTLPSEGGSSLRAAGWKLLGERGGGQWGREGRPRIDVAELVAGQKLLWEAA